VLVESSGSELWPLVRQLGCKSVLCLNKSTSGKLERCRLKATDYNKTQVSVVAADTARRETFQQLSDQKLVYEPGSISAFVSWFSLGSMASSSAHLSDLCTWIAAHLAPGGVWIASGLDSDSVLTALRDMVAAAVTTVAQDKDQDTQTEHSVSASTVVPRLDFGKVASIQLLSPGLITKDSDTFATVSTEWSNNGHGLRLSESLIPIASLERAATAAGLKVLHSSMFEQWDMLATAEVNQDIQPFPSLSPLDKTSVAAALRRFSFLHRSIVLIKV
jgi:hypothetical protein